MYVKKFNFEFDNSIIDMCFNFISGARPGSTGINKMCEGESIYMWTMEICD